MAKAASIKDRELTFQECLFALYAYGMKLFKNIHKKKWREAELKAQLRMESIRFAVALFEKYKRHRLDNVDVYLEYGLNYFYFLDDMFRELAEHSEFEPSQVAAFMFKKIYEEEPNLNKLFLLPMIFFPITRIDSEIIPPTFLVEETDLGIT